MTKLQVLALERIKELGQAAMTAHHEAFVWRPEPLTSSALTDLHVAHSRALESQCAWVNAILEGTDD